MLDDERVSPRAAIHTWLNNAEKRTRPIAKEERLESHEDPDRKECRRIRHDERVSRRSRSPDRDHHPRRHRDHSSDKQRIKNDLTTTAASTYSNARPQKRREEQRSRVSEGPGLAERLGLHAPFRNFRTRSYDGSTDQVASSRPRKRRRRRSSTISYLEPAEIGTPAKVIDDCVRPIERHDTTQDGKEHARNGGDSVSDRRERSTTPLPTERKTIQTYERRPRHKTREDHYELKEDDGNKKKSRSNRNDGLKEKPKKRRRKEKSGAALMHDFSAQNVTNDRLTLQPPKSLGFFGKGRASSPVRRRGLPDLAFSELTFLNSRRSKPEERLKPSNGRQTKRHEQRKSTKAADTEAAISRYFTSAKDPHQTKKSPQSQQKHPNEIRAARDPEFPPTFVDLPDTPFLGFGSCGANPVSPVKEVDGLALTDLERRIDRSPSRSTSYLTWSQSGSPSHYSIHHDQPEGVPTESSKLSTHKENVLESRETALSRQRDSSHHDETNGPEKHRASRTPRHDDSSKSTNLECCLPQQNQTLTGQRQEVRETIADTSVNDDGSKQVIVEETLPKSQPLRSPEPHCGNSPPVPLDTSRDHVDQRYDRRKTSPRISRSELCEDQASLDDVLEALLRDTRTNRAAKEEKISSPPLSFNKKGNTEDLAAGYIDDQSIHDLPHRDPFIPYSRSPISRIPHDNHATVHTKPDDLKYNPVSSIPSDPASRHNVASPNSLYAETNPISHRDPTSNNADSRNAWTGYGTIYERQQEDGCSTSLDEEARQNNGALVDTNRRLSYPPQAIIHQSARHGQSPIYDASYGGDDLEYTELGTGGDPGSWPGGDFYAEDKTDKSHNGWYDFEGNLYAGYDELDTTGGPVPSNRSKYIVDEESQQYGASSMGYSERELHSFGQNVQHASPTWHYHAEAFATPIRVPANTRLSTNTQGITNDPALSGFWTPHKLY